MNKFHLGILVAVCLVSGVQAEGLTREQLREIVLEGRENINTGVLTKKSDDQVRLRAATELYFLTALNVEIDSEVPVERAMELLPAEISKEFMPRCNFVFAGYKYGERICEFVVTLNGKTWELAGFRIKLNKENSD